MPDWLQIVVGLITLVGGGDLLVRGSSWLAVALGIRPMVVGVTIVAFGTSAPELAACVAATLQGSPGLVTGTVFGSNVANIALILGTAALLWPIAHVPGSARFEVRCLLALAMVVPLVLLGDAITWWQGIAGVAFLVWMTTTLIRRERRHRGQRAAGAAEGPRPSAGGYALHSLFVVAGLVLLPVGANQLVEGASRAALHLGVSEDAIGAVLVAFGTSLPELVASVVAALKRHPEIALGNVLGSNVFNLCMVLAGTALLAPIPVSVADHGAHVIANLGLTVLLAYSLAFWRGVGRPLALVFLLLYGAYVAAVLL